MATFVVAAVAPKASTVVNAPAANPHTRCPPPQALKGGAGDLCPWIAAVGGVFISVARVFGSSKGRRLPSRVSVTRTGGPSVQGAMVLAGGRVPTPNFAAVEPQGQRCALIRRRMFDEDDEDQPDDFFERKRPRQRPVVPAWNRYTSPSKVQIGQSCVFFFPQENKQDPHQNGWVNPKMYKRRHMSKRQLHVTRRNRKRAWRKLSKRLKDEWRLRKFPRDESGKVIPGIFQRRDRHNPAFKGLL